MNGSKIGGGWCLSNSRNGGYGPFVALGEGKGRGNRRRTRGRGEPFDF
jgi:hypothetical protein